MKEKERMKVENDECLCEGSEVNGIQGGEKDGEYGGSVRADYKR